MKGPRLQELKEAVSIFIDMTEKLDLGMRIGIVQFGNEAKLLVPLTNDYYRLKCATQDLKAKGKSLMGEGMEVCLNEIMQNGRIFNIEGVTLLPRLILMTVGVPDDKQLVLNVASKLHQNEIPVSCVGVTGCDVQLMQRITEITKGLFVLAQQSDALRLFFIRQLMVVIYIIKMIKDLDSFSDKNLLRSFLEEQTGSSMSQDEINEYVGLLPTLIKRRSENFQSGGNHRLPSFNAHVTSQPITNFRVTVRKTQLLGMVTRYFVELEGATVSKRYSHFRAFHESLPPDLKQAVGQNFPEKTWFGRNSPEVVQMRAQYFETFLNKLIQHSSRGLQLVIDWLAKDQ